jgi:hypothetical protein
MATINSDLAPAIVICMERVPVRAIHPYFLIQANLITQTLHLIKIA